MKEKNVSRTSTAKERRKRRKILLSVLMIIFTGVILTLGTYAWFTANRTIKVNSVDVNVAASNGLQVSADAISWKTVISNDDLNNAIDTYTTAVNQLPTNETSLSPVSTGGNLGDKGFLDMFTGEIVSDVDSGEFTLTASKSTETNGNEGAFVAFDLFFQVREETDIYLTSSSSVKALNTATGIQNAARVAFVDEGTKNISEGYTAIQGLGEGKTVNIWEPNTDVHTAAAIANASSNYEIDGLLGTGAEQLTYSGVIAEIPADANVPLTSAAADYFKAVVPTITSTAAGIPTDAYKKAFTLAAGVTKVRVYMWIEGQDVDCEDNASGGALSFNLEFSSNTKSGA